MSLRAIIIDDEETGIETLQWIIEKHIPGLRVIASATRGSQAIQQIRNYRPEVVFLDISMPEMDGFELLSQLEWKDFTLVFVTAHKEYALRAFKHNAVDYLLKPVDPNELYETVERIKKQQQPASQAAIDYTSLNDIHPYASHKLALSSKDSIEYIDPKEIISMESQSNYTRVYLNNGRMILTPRTLREFDTLLCQGSFNFMRVHHSFILNLQKIVRYLKEEEDIIMVNNQKIPLSKSRRENFLRWMNG